MQYRKFYNKTQRDTTEKSKKHDENAKKKKIEKEDTRSTHNKQMHTYSFTQ